MKDSRVDLPKALEKLPVCSFRDNLIQMAMRGAFHDFLSHLDTPKMTLVELLETAAKKTGDKRYLKLAEDAKRGRFDDDVPKRKKR